MKLVNIINRLSNSSIKANTRHFSFISVLFKNVKNYSNVNNKALALLDNREQLQKKLQSFFKKSGLEISKQEKDDILRQETSPETINNIHKIHLSLIEYFLNDKKSESSKEFMHHFNKLFENWFSTATTKLKVDKQDRLRAFELVLEKEYSLYKCFNSIYKFDENFDAIKDRLDDFMRTSPKDFVKLYLINEMKLKNYSNLVDSEAVNKDILRKIINSYFIF